MLNFYMQSPKETVHYRHAEGDYAAEFHLHEYYEIFFFISGNVNYLIENSVYQLKYGDLFVINNHEIHKPSILGDDNYERITIHFNPMIAQIFSTENSNLLNCFLDRSAGEKNKISLDNNQKTEILDMLKRLERLHQDKSSYSKILKLTNFIELLVFINKAFLRTNNMEEYLNIPAKLIPIIDYIDKNLDGDLSLKTLEKKFYINSSYLSRLFKQSTGSNIHEYIIYKRISKAKKLIMEGHSATETCLLSGFKDYSNFSRTFKKTVGVTVSEYKALPRKIPIERIFPEDTKLKELFKTRP